MERYIRIGSALLRSRLMRVLIIGGIGFIIQTALFELLSVYLKIVLPSTGVVIGGETAVLCNFYLNNRFSFTENAHKTASLASRLLRFHLVVSGSIFIQWLFVFLTEHATANVLLINGAYVAGVIVGFVSNYTGYRLWVWKHHEAA